MSKVFITAKPRTGKSTAIKKVVEHLGKKNCVGFYTEEIRKEGKRTGFKMITMDGQEGIIASTDFESDIRLGRYGLDLKTFEKLCINSLSHLPANKVVIIDEVGPMQMFSKVFQDILLKLVNNEHKIIGTIYYENHPWIDTFKKITSVSLQEITLENRDEIPDQLYKYIQEVS